MTKRAYKYRFYPQNDLKVILAKTFGCVRFVYNQTLDFSEKHYSNKSVLESQGLVYKNTAGTAANACGGKVRPKTSKKIISKRSRAISNETGIPLL